MSTIYAQRSSAVRAAKKACGPNQEWVIVASGEGFVFNLLDIEEKQPKVEEVLAALPQGFNHNTSEGRQAAKKAIEKSFEEVTEAEHIAHRAESPIKPYQLAKSIVADCLSKGITLRKDIIASCIAQGIKYNTADGAHYELCVRKG